MKVTTLAIDGAYLVDLDLFGDERGFFLESYSHRRYVEHGIEANFVQDNRSFTKYGVLRGLHYQVNQPIGHLIYVTHGSIFDVGLDLRVDSPSFGKHIEITLAAEKNQQLYLPPGVAHGFCSLSQDNEVLYKCTEYYVPSDEAGVLWSDPELGIRWPIHNPVTNERDNNFPSLADLDPSLMPKVKNYPG